MARRAGYEVLGLPDITMQHHVGKRSMCVAVRSIAVHAPFRSCYLVRNALLLARKPHLGQRWRMHFVCRAFGHLMLLTFLVPGGGQRLAWMLRSFRDGVLGCGGLLGGPDCMATPHTLVRVRAARCPGWSNCLIC